MKLYLSVFRDFWKLIFLKIKTVVSKKKFHFSCDSEGKIEKSVPLDHSLSSLGKPRDAKGRSSGRYFNPTLTLMIVSYITQF